jgi:hypothetical protein
MICLRCRAEWRVGSTGKRVESVGRMGEVIEGRCSLSSPEETKERARLTLFKQARNKQLKHTAKEPDPMALLAQKQAYPIQPTIHSLREEAARLIDEHESLTSSRRVHVALWKARQARWRTGTSVKTSS